jgi:peptidoglycan/xylan/chitin deacetylase (PgdA/CDA1 family)
VRLPVLLYHSVAEVVDPRFAQWSVAPEQFAAQMDLLAGEGYRTLTVRELAEQVWTRREPVPDRVVAITFDDGFADFYTTAWPHLRRHGLTATVFVTTGYLGSTSAWLSRVGHGGRPMMSWAQVSQIADAGIEVGAHGHTHLQLDAVSPARAAREIDRSRRALVNAIGPVVSFAYPHGYHTRQVRREVRRAGFTSACAVGDGLASASDDAYAITRAIVRGGTGIEAFARILAGDFPERRRRPIRRAAWRAVRIAGGEPMADRLRESLAARPSG